MTQISMSGPLRVIGLMSGTSMDGVDAAYVETDGAGSIHTGAALTEPFEAEFRARLKRFVSAAPDRGASPDEKQLEQDLTDLHAVAVEKLLAQMGMRAGELDFVGFHGQTIWHRPDKGQTWQMGDGGRLAQRLGIPVAFDFRTDDLQHGGQGAPLLPIFHAALAPQNDAPIAVLNVGGVANITWINGAGKRDNDSLNALLGFDTGPGNGLIDDWVTSHLGLPMDAGGTIAAKGKVDDGVLDRMLATPFLDRRPPKSLDRFAFPLDPLAQMSAEDGAATLTAFTAACVARALVHCPEKPQRLFVTGGGRHNATLMKMLAERTGVTVTSVDTIGWQGDALEAQAFGYLAVRCARGLPITFPGTTGVSAPQTGGRIAQPR